MKKVLAFVLATVMLLSLAACDDKSGTTAGNDATKAQTAATESAGQSGQAQTQTPEAAQPEAQPAASTGYKFRGYTEVADWLDAASWEGLGLPELTLTEDVSGTVHISDKDWIYPLNGSDGVLIEVKTTESQIDGIVEALKAAGIDMYEDQGYETGYTGYYDRGSDKMKVTVSETGLGKLSIKVITNPTD